MIETLKRAARRSFSLVGLDVRRQKPVEELLPVEFEAADIEIFKFVTANDMTMVSTDRLATTIAASKHAALCGIEGDFVECGVWRGGNAVAAKMVFEHYGAAKRVFMFDTFAGMTKPGEFDQKEQRFTWGRRYDAQDYYEKSLRNGETTWVRASLDDVRGNFERANVNQDGLRYIVGDVRETLREPGNLPSKIAVLRLDTDFYESTLVELEVLYPLLSSRGSLLIDDYGEWQGARRAVDEYIRQLPPSERPLLHVTDATGRAAVKP